MQLRMFASVLVLLVAVFSVPAGSVAAQTPADYWPTGEWRTSSPEDQSLDRKILKRLVKRIRKNKIRDLNSLLIVRNGYLVVESYFNGSGPNDVHTLQSDTKSVTSLLIGAAIAQGKLAGVDEPILEFFPEYRHIKNLDERKSSLRIKDLLTMRTGFDWSEAVYQGSPLQRLNDCRCDWLRFVLDWPMAEEPGTRFEYNSGGVILLGGVIRKAAGTSVDGFAQQNLFDPLGITNAWWYQGLPEGLTHTGGGLNLRARDMAKIGYLILRRGRWEDKQIVSEDWLRESMQHRVRNARTFGSHPVDYGYLWWLLPIEHDEEPDGDIYTAAGARDQWIFIIPKFDMVVVVTGNTSTTFAEPVDFLYSDILRAVM
ncbi:MAG TPA: serine hydrolase [Blastocatellia bacterium]|nr:serine hydrolase [Blastocatellia bacterium]